MAQAESTPNPVRDFFTAADTAHSTNEIAGPTRQLRQKRRSVDRRYFIGGSDARIVMGTDEGALLRLWREKRGEIVRRIFRAISSSSLAWRPRS